LAGNRDTDLTCTHMITRPLTEGDLDRGRAPDLKSPHWRCSTVDPATGAVCTADHTATTSSTRVTTPCRASAGPPASPPGSSGPNARWSSTAIAWNRLPGTDVEVTGAA
jgi:hypothetical protein